jgi:hypothetical protein
MEALFDFRLIADKTFGKRLKFPERELAKNAVQNPC